MAIAVDASSSHAGAGAGTGSLTWAHTCTGSNLRLMVGVAIVHTTATVSGVTYNSDAMTDVVASARGGDNHIVHIWTLAAPDTGGAFNIVATFSENVSLCDAGAVSLTGASVMGATNTAVGSAGSPSVALTTTAVNSWIFSIVGGGNTDFSGTTGTNQTERWVRLDYSGSQDCAGSTQTTTSITSYTQSWGGGQTWDIASAEVTPAAVATAGKFASNLGLMNVG